MGNINEIDHDDHKHKLKSLKDIMNDIKIMNDIYEYMGIVILKVEMKALYQI